jgi:hypothetical protein
VGVVTGRVAIAEQACSAACYELSATLLCPSARAAVPSATPVRLLPANSLCEAPLSGLGTGSGLGVCTRAGLATVPAPLWVALVTSCLPWCRRRPGPPRAGRMSSLSNPRGCDPSQPRRAVAPGRHDQGSVGRDRDHDDQAGRHRRRGDRVDTTAAPWPPQPPIRLADAGPDRAGGQPRRLPASWCGRRAAAGPRATPGRRPGGAGGLAGDHLIMPRRRQARQQVGGGEGTRLRRVLLRWQAPQPLRSRPPGNRRPGRDLYAGPHAGYPRTPSPVGCAVPAGYAPSGEWSGHAARSASRDWSIGASAFLGGPSARAASVGSVMDARVSCLTSTG